MTRKLPRYTLVAALVAASFTVLGTPSASAATPPEPPPTFTTNVVAPDIGAAATNGCRSLHLSITARSGIFHTPLYTYNLAKSFCWGYGVVVENPASMAWFSGIASNWSNPHTLSLVNQWYWLTSDHPHTGHRTTAVGEIQCNVYFVSRACGYGHPELRIQAHGNGTYTHYARLG